MARKRPTVLTVMGILNIVFGSLALLCSFCGVLSLLINFANLAKGGQFQNGPNPFAESAEMQAFIKAQVPGYAAVQVGQVVLNLVLSAALLIAGIGLLKIKAWGRVLSIAYCITDIVVTLGGLVYTMALVNPAMERFFQGKPNPLANATFLNAMTVAGAILSIAYAVVLLIMMLLPSISTAFARKYAADEYDLDRRDDEDDLQRERRPRDDWEQ